MRTAAAPPARGRIDPIGAQMPGDEPEAVRRRRDAGTTRERLLVAATDLFAERGFDRATVRDIGDRAGVDAALIARYFGGKTELYIETLRARTDSQAGDLLESDRLARLLDRASQREPGPILQAAVRTHDDAKAQTAAVAELQQRLIAPLRDRFVRAGCPDPQLRAEVVIAAFVGIYLSRSVGTLTELATADSETLVPMVTEILSGRLD